MGQYLVKHRDNFTFTFTSVYIYNHSLGMSVRDSQVTLYFSAHSSRCRVVECNTRLWTQNIKPLCNFLQSPVTSSLPSPDTLSTFLSKHSQCLFSLKSFSSRNIVNMITPWLIIRRDMQHAQKNNKRQQNLWYEILKTRDQLKEHR